MILTTTGNAATVTITGLRAQDNSDVVLAHGTASATINLLDFYDEEDIKGVETVIQAQIDAGNITAQTQNGDPITDVSNSLAGIADLQADVDALESDQAAQDITIGLNQTSNTSQDALIASNSSSITSIQSVQTTQNNNISQNASDISAEVSNRVSADTALQNQINSNASNITTNTNDIDSIETQQVNQDTAIAANTAKVSFPEAPNDGNQYARQSLGWSPVSGGGSSPWNTNANGIDYDAGNVGIGTNNPIADLQIGEQFNDTQTNSVEDQLQEIKIYAGQNTNDGVARIHLLESVPQAFPGDYGAIIEYNGSTNLFSLITVQAGTETVAFTFERATQIASLFATANMNNNSIINVANPTTAQGAVTAVLTDMVKVRNAAEITNVNTGVTQLTGLNTTPEIASLYGQFTVQANGITPQFTGVARLTFTAELEGPSGQRTNVSFRWNNGTINGPWNQETYIRRASNHNQSTGKVIADIPCVSGQQIFIEHDNQAASGNVSVPANALEFSLQRIR